MQKIIASLQLFLLLGSFAPAQTGLQEDYNQWKEALGTNQATPGNRIQLPAGFEVQLLRSAQPGEGSWVAMAFDPQGQLVVAREDRGLWRFRLSPDFKSVEHLDSINTNLLECRGLLFAHGALYANANNSKGLFRLRDRDGDGRYEEPELLRRTPGGVGHGRNQLALGPDGFIYSIHGDDVGLPTNGVSPVSPLKHYGEDRLLPSSWDRHLFNADARMPFGHLIRTDPDGNSWEVVAGGLRNPFGIDFNPAGDFFTFDADMEWDVGLPWYHPTRVLHLVPGGDYGWRRGTGVLPEWFPDTLPSAVDLGVSSPTAIKFGTKSHWPEKWKRALYLLDWSYGKIIAVHLEPRGASYRGRAETFALGRPLNVTGLEFGPDGAMYFITGGRRTQSGLYRVSWTGAYKREKPSRIAGNKSSSAPLWTRLNESDHWIRYQARVELESVPGEDWVNRALTEKRPNAGLTSLLALSRVGSPSLQLPMVGRLLEWHGRKISAEQRLIALRALEVGFIRMGRPAELEIKKIRRQLEEGYPYSDSRVNQMACELLVYLSSEVVAAKTIPLLAEKRPQEEKIFYLFTLSSVTNGWTASSRATYFRWLQRARNEFQGANMLPTALNYIRAEAMATLSESERENFRDLLELRPTAPVTAPSPRKLVKEWSMTDAPALLSISSRDRARGGRLYSELGCRQCHRVAGDGGLAGPDLTDVGARFDRRALLESLIEPSRVVAEVYRQVTLTTKSGVIFDGRVINEDEKSLVMAINPVDPDQRRRVLRAEISSLETSSHSPMPDGLLNSSTAAEIADLLTWLSNPR